MTTKIKKSKLLIMALPIAAVTFSLVSWTKINETLADSNTTLVAIQDDKVYDKVDVMPKYNGGMTALGAFIGENIKYPKASQKKRVEGKVFIQFVVDKTGAVKDVSIAKGLDEATNNEAVRVIKLMPNWTPGEKDGKKVSVKMNLPIKFQLAD